MFGSGWRDTCFKRCLSDLVEVAQHHPTRRETRDRVVVLVSRLARFYVAAATVELLDMLPVASVIGIATEYDRVSGHLPVRLTLSIPDSRPRRTGVIPRWSLSMRSARRSSPSFLLTLLLTTPTYERLCLFKGAAHAASVVLKRKLADRPARTLQEQLHWACLLYRAARSGDCSSVRVLGLVLVIGSVLLPAVCSSSRWPAALPPCIALSLNRNRRSLMGILRPPMMRSLK